MNSMAAGQTGPSLPSGLAEILTAMEGLLRRETDPPDAQLKEALDAMMFSGGKRLRPVLAWLSAGFGQPASEQLLSFMSMLELMHTASLLHDDVIDGAALRRGQPTVYSLRGRRGAVGAGDYILGLFISRMPALFGTGLNQRLAETSRQMCLGEFQQARNLFSFERQTRENYFLQIRRKTAYLISDSCWGGAVLGGLPRIWQESLMQFGLFLGMSFQINDDILDIKGGHRLGKPRGQDLRQGIFTLPVLYAAEEQPDARLMALAEKREKTKEELAEIFQWIEASRGLECAKNIADDISDRATAALAPLPAGSVKGSLMRMVDALSKREK